MPRILFVGAFDGEISLLLESGPGPDWEARAAGVGGLPAALWLQEFLADGAVSEVVFLGSAGVYPGSRRALEGAEFAWSRLFFNRELAVLEGRAKIPGPMPDVLRSQPGPFAKRAAGLFAEAAVNCPDSVTLAELRPETLLGLGEAEGLPRLENLECFGLALAAQRAGTPFAALLALTNDVGPDGSRQWMERHKALGLRLQETVLDLLRGARPRDAGARSP